jgi:hypothetical protein
MKQRFVLYSEQEGIYLGNAMGLGFWSKLDPVGQDVAVTFATPEEAVGHVRTWDNPERFLKKVRARAVMIEDTAYATIPELVAAGLPAWDPDAVYQG